MPPKVIGPYRVLETLGSGGVGTVYRALDRRTNEAVALKLLAAGPALDSRAARRLAREFEALQDLSHPNVVKVFDTGVYHGYPYLTMELVEGLTLRHYLSFSDDDLIRVSNSLARPSKSATRSRSMSLSRSMDPDDDDFDEETDELDSGPDSVRAFADALDEPDTNSRSDYDLPYELKEASKPPPAEKPRPVNLDAYNKPERVAKLKDAMLQLCQALSYVHGRGLIHRDLKPSNVMVDQDRLVRLMDFGLAKFLAADDGVTGDGRLVGTFRYMSPEQILDEPLDARSDLYALGVIMFELLSGRAPFEARTPYELWEKALETDAPMVQQLNPNADPQLARVAHRLIRKDPEDRYQTAEEVYEALAE